MTYSVAYTIGKDRLFEDFKKKSSALKFAKKVTKDGATKVFLDTYDKDNDLIDYIKIA